MGFMVAIFSTLNSEFQISAMLIAMLQESICMVKALTLSLYYLGLVHRGSAANRNRACNNGTAAAMFEPISKVRMAEVHELNACALLCMLSPLYT